MKILSIIILQAVLGASNLVQADTIQADRIITIVNGTKYNCTQNINNIVKCIPHCLARYRDGSCSAYGSDYCGVEPQCSPNCESRYSDGSCSRYKEDICSSL